MHLLRCLRLLLFLCAVAPVFAADKPNIIFFLFDDMGYAQPQSYSAGSKLRTPNLDKLVTQGMRFTDAHTAAAVCTPTRYGVITGRYPSRIGQFGVLTTYSPPIIPKERLTVASMLKQHGYRTACIGKWHLGMIWDGQPGTQSSVPVGTKLIQSPDAHGFDLFYGFTHARNIGTIIEHDKVVANVQPVENQPLMIKKALGWIKDRAEEKAPFFLYFPMCPPHEPLVPAAEFVGKSGAVDVVKKNPQYGDWLYQGDHMLGQIMQALDDLKLADNTLLIATSDNGAEGRAYEPLRGSKRSIYEGGHRVPYVVRWPGKVKPGSVNRDVICLNDLMATAAEIVGAKIPDNAGEDSVSILPALTGTAKGPVREATIHQSSTGDLAIRQGPWKMIFMKDGQRELYNLESDLSETRNALADHPDQAKALTVLMQSYIDKGRSTAGSAQKNEFELSIAGGEGKAKGKNRKAKKAAKQE